MVLRMVIAIVLFILLITGGILEEVYVSKLFTDFGDKLDEVSNAQGGKYDLDKMQEVYDWWVKKTNTMHMFLPHNPLNDITLALGEMKGAVQSGDVESATAQHNRIHAIIDTLEETFSFSASNIF